MRPLNLLRGRDTSEAVAIRSGNTVDPWRVLVDSNYSVKLGDGRKNSSSKCLLRHNSRSRSMIPNHSPALCGQSCPRSPFRLMLGNCRHDRPHEAAEFRRWLTKWSRGTPPFPCIFALLRGPLGRFPGCSLMTAASCRLILITDMYFLTWARSALGSTASILFLIVYELRLANQYPFDPADRRCWCQMGSSRRG